MREPADRLVSQVSQARTRIIATDGRQYSGKKAPKRSTDCPRICGAGSHAGPPCLRRGGPFLMISCSCPLLQLRLAMPAHASSLPRLQAASSPAWLTVALGQRMDGLGGRAHALLLVEKPDLSAPRRRGSRGEGHRSGMSSTPGPRWISGGSSRCALSALAP